MMDEDIMVRLDNQVLEIALDAIFWPSLYENPDKILDCATRYFKARIEQIEGDK